MLHRLERRQSAVFSSVPVPSSAVSRPAPLRIRGRRTADEVMTAIDPAGLGCKLIVRYHKGRSRTYRTNAVFLRHRQKRDQSQQSGLSGHRPLGKDVKGP